MRVICIKNGEWRNREFGFITPGPKYMEEFLVVSIKPESGFYYLRGYDGQCYNPVWFIPLSELNETVIHAEYILQTN